MLKPHIANYSPNHSLARERGQILSSRRVFYGCLNTMVALRVAGFDVLVGVEPDQAIGQIPIPDVAQQQQEAAEQRAEGQMIRQDNPTVMASGLGIGPGERDKVLHVEGDERPSLACGERELVGVGAFEIFSFMGGKTINAAIPEDSRQQRTDVLVKVQFERHGVASV